LQSYPSLEASQRDWKALQSVPTPREVRRKAVVKAGDEELGLKIKDARVKKGWSKDDLARKIVKRNGQRIAKSSISGYEDGWTNPPKYILEQIKTVLEMEI
jgi:ribosome-binding protein aMBF1 (putative translation factor)